MISYEFKRYPGMAGIIIQHRSDGTTEMCIEGGKLRRVAAALVSMAEQDERLTKAPAAKDDEAPTVARDIAELTRLLRVVSNALDRVHTHLGALGIDYETLRQLYGFVTEIRKSDLMRAEKGINR